jgi:predicted aldo/keto reductase-like oxidoreductase
MPLDQYFTLGSSGLRVSRLALGTMTFGESWGWGTDERTARTMFERYLSVGRNFNQTPDQNNKCETQTLHIKIIPSNNTPQPLIKPTK